MIGASPPPTAALAAILAYIDVQQARSSIEIQPSAVESRLGKSEDRGASSNIFGSTVIAVRPREIFRSID